MRFRYYKDEKVFDSADVKNFYTLQIPSDLLQSTIIAKFRAIVGITAQAIPGGPGEIDECIIQDSFDKFMEVLHTKSWTNISMDLSHDTKEETA